MCELNDSLNFGQEWTQHSRVFTSGDVSRNYVAFFEQVDPTLSVLKLTVIMLDSILDSVCYVLVGCYRHME
jgi:hypothetical protein